MQPLTLRLGYSPCPNDTFIFYALAHGRVALPPHRLIIELADVEELNRAACAHVPDITKVSVNALPHILDEYWLLRAGGALGRGCGPLVVARAPVSMESLGDKRLAIPGRLTTANLLLQLHGGHRGERVAMVFDEIMPAILRGDVDAGVIIHEGRFTYRALGLHQVLDLGSWWERTTSLPLPLGAIVMRRALGASLAVRVEEAIRASLGHSRRHPEEAHHYVARHAQEMEPAVIDQHIATFVNDYTVNLGVEGEEAMRKLVEAACREAHTQAPALPLFRTQAC